VSIDGTIVGHASAEKVPDMLRDFLATHASRQVQRVTETLPLHPPHRGATTIHAGSVVLHGQGSDQLFHARAPAHARAERRST